MFIAHDRLGCRFPVGNVAAVKRVDITYFGLDGVDYAVVLSESDANRLRRAIGPFVAAARATGFHRPRADREQPGRIREWARERGYHPCGRGVLPFRVVQEFARAQIDRAASS